MFSSTSKKALLLLEVFVVSLLLLAVACVSSGSSLFMLPFKLSLLSLPHTAVRVVMAVSF